jgi:integrase
MSALEAYGMAPGQQHDAAEALGFILEAMFEGQAGTLRRLATVELSRRFTCSSRLVRSAILTCRGHESAMKELSSEMDRGSERISIEGESAVFKAASVLNRPFDVSAPSRRSMLQELIRAELLDREVTFKFPAVVDASSCQQPDRTIERSKGQSIDGVISPQDVLVDLEVKAVESRDFAYLPDVFVIRIGREADKKGEQKNRHRVLLPEALDFEGAGDTFRLAAVIAHSGERSSFGHYAALVSVSDSAFLIDDESVTPMTVQGFNTSPKWDAYVVAYVRERPRSKEMQKKMQQSGIAERVDVDKAHELFRCRQGMGPSLAALKGHSLEKLSFIEAEALKQLNPLMGKTEAIRRRHLNALRQMQVALRETLYASMSLPHAVVTVLQRQAKDRGWRPSTLARELANFAGAMADLPIYSNSPVGFKLGQDPLYAAALKSSNQMANESSASSQPAACLDDILWAVQWAPDLATKCLLILTWLCAGRVGDVAKLKRHEVALESDFLQTGRLKVLFCRGKGARFNQPYTVPTVCLVDWRSTLARYLEALDSPKAWCFPGGEKKFGPLANLALRCANPEFSVRALRRGALQRMAAAGATDADLMIFSGHKRVDTLHRYLNWGAEAAERTRRAEMLASNLAQTPLVSQAA